VRPKVDQRAGHLSPPHVEITKTEKIELKRKTDEKINPAVESHEISPTGGNGLRWRIIFSEKVGFELRVKQ